jgi:hypothetical protein
MKQPDFNLYPDPYCIAFYDAIEKKIICFEQSDKGARELTLDERANKKECINCPQLTEAWDLLQKDLGE